MKLLKRIFIALLILLTFNLYLPSISFAEAAVTKHEPEILSTPEEDIPEEDIPIKENGKSSWTWVILLALVGGLAAAVGGGGGGGGDGGGGGSTPPPDEGDVTVTW